MRGERLSATHLSNANSLRAALSAVSESPGAMCPCSWEAVSLDNVGIAKRRSAVSSVAFSPSSAFWPS